MTAAPVVADLVAANRILYARGVLDGFGHVSARDPQDAGAFLLSRNLAPASVGPDDVMRFTLDGAAAAGDDRRPYLERFIHGAIYAARPDVGAVVHSHSPAVIPFGIAQGARLRAVSHMSGFLGDGVPVFEIRDAAGDDTDMLIRDPVLGAALASALGAHAVVLMRGHGSTAVGRDVRQAVFRAVYTEVNARLQSDALRLGELVPLNAREAQRAALTNDGQIDRAWELWRREAGLAPSLSP